LLRIQQISGGRLEIQQGSRYPALYRLERLPGGSDGQLDSGPAAPRGSIRWSRSGTSDHSRTECEDESTRGVRVAGQTLRAQFDQV